MSCIVLDFQLADKNFIEELGFFLWECSGILVSSCKKAKTYKTSVLVYKKFERNGENSGRLDYRELANILTTAVKGEYFAKVTEKRKILNG